MANKVSFLGTLSEVGAGAWIPTKQGPLNAQVTLLTASAAVVAVEFSVDQIAAVEGVEITVSGGGPRSDGEVFDEELSWPYARMRVVSINGGTVIASMTIKE